MLKRLYKILGTDLCHCNFLLSAPKNWQHLAAAILHQICSNLPARFRNYTLLFLSGIVDFAVHATWQTIQTPLYLSRWTPQTNTLAETRLVCNWTLFDVAIPSLLFPLLVLDNLTSQDSVSSAVVLLRKVSILRRTIVTDYSLFFHRTIKRAMERSKTFKFFWRCKKMRTVPFLCLLYWERLLNLIKGTGINRYESINRLLPTLSDTTFLPLNTFFGIYFWKLYNHSRIGRKSKPLPKWAINDSHFRTLFFSANMLLQNFSIQS